MGITFWCCSRANRKSKRRMRIRKASRNSPKTMLIPRVKAFQVAFGSEKNWIPLFFVFSAKKNQTTPFKWHGRSESESSGRGGRKGLNLPVVHHGQATGWEPRSCENDHGHKACCPENHKVFLRIALKNIFECAMHVRTQHFGVPELPTHRCS